MDKQVEELCGMGCGVIWNEPNPDCVSAYHAGNEPPSPKRHDLIQVDEQTTLSVNRPADAPPFTADEIATFKKLARAAFQKMSSSTGRGSS